MAKRFLQLNGLAILAVVLFHAAGWGFTAMFAWPHRYLAVSSPDFSQMGSMQYFGLRFIEQLAVFSIPAFLAISGTFVAVSTGASGLSRWDRVLGRLKSLLPPYLLWTVVLAGLQIMQGGLIGLREIPSILLTGGINPAYYFIPLLAQYYLLSPWLSPMARRHPKWLLVGTGLIQLALYGLHYLLILQPESQLIGQAVALFPKWFFPTRLFWFSLGMVVGFHSRRVVSSVTPQLTKLAALSLLLLLVGMFEWELLVRQAGPGWVPHRETLVDGLYSLSFLGMMLATPGIEGRMFDLVSKVGARSYGIYLAHSPVMEYLARGIYHLAPWILGNQLILQPMLVAAGLFIPLGLMWPVRATRLKVVYRFVFG